MTLFTSGSTLPLKSLDLLTWWDRLWVLTPAILTEPHALPLDTNPSACGAMEAAEEAKEGRVDGTSESREASPALMHLIHSAFDRLLARREPLLKLRDTSDLMEALRDPLSSDEADDFLFASSCTPNARKTGTGAGVGVEQTSGQVPCERPRANSNWTRPSGPVSFPIAFPPSSDPASISGSGL